MLPSGFEPESEPVFFPDRRYRNLGSDKRKGSMLGLYTMGAKET